MHDKRGHSCTHLIKARLQNEQLLVFYTHSLRSPLKIDKNSKGAWTPYFMYRYMKYNALVIMIY